MNAIPLCNTPDTPTSALGCLYASGLDATLATAVIPTAMPGQATANTYAQGSMTMATMIALRSERTTTGPAGQIDYVPAETTAEAVMEIRRRSGLTWEELGELFDVSRRSVHHWANGKPVNAKSDRTIRRMLAAIRHLDEGNQTGTRALLLAVDQTMGVSALDLLKDGRFDEAVGRVEGGWTPEHQRIPLSSAARDARRPQAPMLLLEADQERPRLPAKARIARAKRMPKKTD